MSTNTLTQRSQKQEIIEQSALGYSAPIATRP